MILDRDGVINHDSDGYIKSLEEWEPIPGSIEAMVRLSRAGCRIAIASNQSGLARGLFTHSALNAMHQRLRELVVTGGGRIELIAFCPHGPDEKCRCRKPRTGLLEEIAFRLDVNLAGIPFIGDSLSDIRAARSVGAMPVLVRSGKGLKTAAGIGEPLESLELQGVPVYRDLDAAANALLAARG